MTAPSSRTERRVANYAHAISGAAPAAYRPIRHAHVCTSCVQLTQARDFYDYAHMRVSTYSSVGNGGMAPVA